MFLTSLAFFFQFQNPNEIKAAKLTLVNLTLMKHYLSIAKQASPFHPKKFNWQCKWQLS